MSSDDLALLLGRLKRIYIMAHGALALSALTLSLSPPPELTGRDIDGALSLYSALSLGLCFLGMVLHYQLLRPARVAKARQASAAVFSGYLIAWLCFTLAGGIGLMIGLSLAGAEHAWPVLTLAALSLLSHPPLRGKLKRAMGVR